MNEITRNLLWTIAVAALAAALILSIGTAVRLDTTRGNLDDMKESLAAQAQTMAELWQAVDGLKGKMRMLDGGHKVLLIMGTGHEVIIRTEDGQILKCYFPDEPAVEGGNK